MRYTPSRKEIDWLVKYVANMVDRERWFSIRWGHGYSAMDQLPVLLEYGAEIADWAVRLHFFEVRMTPGSGGYAQYRITRSGLRHAEEMEEKQRAALSQTTTGATQ